MKQINLLPVDRNQSTKIEIHPFWTRYLAMTVALSAIAFTAGLTMTGKIETYDIQANQAENRLEQITEQTAFFDELIQRQSALKAEAERIRTETEALDVAWLRDDASMLAQLAAVIQAMPPSISLDSLDGDFEASTVTLAGFAGREDDVIAFSARLAGMALFDSVRILRVSDLNDKSNVQFTLEAGLAPPTPGKTP